MTSTKTQSLSSNSYDIDLVFCLDTTGAMWPILDAFKSQIPKFHELFYEYMKKEDKSLGTLRLKLIAFKDLSYPEEGCLLESEFFTLPEDTELLTLYSEALEARGGGDIPESALEALALAMKSDWTQGEAKKRNIIALFTDAPPHPLGHGIENPQYPSNMPKDLSELFDWWESPQNFGLKMNERDSRLVILAPDCDLWKELTIFPRSFIIYQEQFKPLDVEGFYQALSLIFGGP